MASKATVRRGPFRAPGAPAPPAQAPPAAPLLPQLGPPERPSLGLFSRIKAPGDVDPVLELAATGVQIFRCEQDKDGTGYRWMFRLPEAELRDASGQVVGHHGANYSFEHVDGSRLIGTIVGYEPAPGGAIKLVLEGGRRRRLKIKPTVHDRTQYPLGTRVQVVIDRDGSLKIRKFLRVSHLLARHFA